MRRVFVLALVVVGLGFAWAKASGIEIHWTADVDTHITPYRKHCGQVVAQFLGSAGHMRMTQDRYEEMIDELQSCNKTADTPTAH